jgi:hypothetical protein
VLLVEPVGAGADDLQRVAPALGTVPVQLLGEVRAPDHLVEHQVEQLALAGDVAVERHGPHAELGGDPAHGERREPLPIGERDGGGDDALQRQPRLRPATGRLPALPQELEAAADVAASAVCRRHGWSS